MRTSLALLLALTSCKPGGEREESNELATANVQCTPVTAQSIDDLVEVTGVIAPPPKLDAVISSPVAGRISQVSIEEGDHVAVGALLAVVDDPSLPAGTVEAKANVAAAQAAKVAADQELARQQRLIESGIGARRDLDEARAKAAAAAAELDAANARSGLATRNNARRELRAPHAGVVLHVWKRNGESVDGTTATPVAEIADISTLELRAQLPASAFAEVHDGMSASVRVANGSKDLAGKVVRVAPAVDPSTLLGSVRIQLAGGTDVAVGSAATAQISTNRRPGLVVPAAAVRRSLVGTDEVVTCENGVAHVRPVTIGVRRETTLEIREGVNAGEQVVVDHVLGIEDGQHLQVK